MTCTFSVGADQTTFLSIIRQKLHVVRPKNGDFSQKFLRFCFFGGKAFLTLFKNQKNLSRSPAPAEFQHSGAYLLAILKSVISKIMGRPDPCLKMRCFQGILGFWESFLTQNSEPRVGHTWAEVVVSFMASRDRSIFTGHFPPLLALESFAIEVKKKDLQGEFLGKFNFLKFWELKVVPPRGF